MSRLNLQHGQLARRDVVGTSFVHARPGDWEGHGPVYDVFVKVTTWDDLSLRVCA